MKLNALIFSQRPIFFHGETNIPADKIAKLRETLNLLDSFLQENSYVAGNNPTIADISILSTFIMFQSTFMDYGEIPNVNVWFKKCQSLEGFQENIDGNLSIFYCTTLPNFVKCCRNECDQSSHGS